MEYMLICLNFHSIVFCSSILQYYFSSFSYLAGNTNIEFCSKQLVALTSCKEFLHLFSMMVHLFFTTLTGGYLWIFLWGNRIFPIIKFLPEQNFTQSHSIVIDITNAMLSVVVRSDFSVHVLGANLCLFSTFCLSFYKLNIFIHRILVFFSLDALLKNTDSIAELSFKPLHIILSYVSLHIMSAFVVFF